MIPRGEPGRRIGAKKNRKYRATRRFLSRVVGLAPNHLPDLPILRPLDKPYCVPYSVSRMVCEAQ
jgi:hypothetical protein